MALSAHRVLVWVLPSLAHGSRARVAASDAKLLSSSVSADLHCVSKGVLWAHGKTAG